MLKPKRENKRKRKRERIKEKEKERERERERKKKNCSGSWKNLKEYVTVLAPKGYLLRLVSSRSIIHLLGYSRNLYAILMRTEPTVSKRISE